MSSQAGYCNHRGHMQARISSLLAFLTDLWKLKEEAIAKQGKSEVGVLVVVMDDNLDGSDDDGDENTIGDGRWRQLRLIRNFTHKE